MKDRPSVDVRASIEEKPDYVGVPLLDNTPLILGRTILIKPAVSQNEQRCGPLPLKVR